MQNIMIKTTQNYNFTFHKKNHEMFLNFVQEVAVHLLLGTKNIQENTNNEVERKTKKSI